MRCEDCEFLLTHGSQNACMLTGNGMPRLSEACEFIDDEYRFADGSSARDYVRAKYYEMFVGLYEIITQDEDERMTITYYEDEV